MEEIAQVYARSLFEVAESAGKLDAVRDQLGAVADALASDRDLQIFFFSPYFSSQEKADGLHKAVTDIEKHRMPVLLRIRRVYDALWEDYNKLLPVEITSAVELDEKIVKHIGDRISEQTGRRVELSATVEPDILGGIIVRVGNQVLDASIRRRLDQLRRQVARAA